MFEPFQRFSDHGSAGLGLGLAVARGLAEAVGATISAEDTPGGGLTLVVAVPRADAPIPYVRVADSVFDDDGPVPRRGG
jgi:two-component system sensor histidine kinase KdpD